MKATSHHYRSVDVTAFIIGNDRNIKVEIGQNSGPVLATFWFPATSLNKTPPLVPGDIVKSRCKRLGITYDHYTITYR